MKYTPLHVHTDISPDGAGRISSLLDYAKDVGFETMAVTDHGSLGSWVTFFLESRKRGIKPVLGVEAYLLYDGDVCHITLLAINRAGYDNIIKTQNEAASRSEKKTITLELNLFEELGTTEGIVALTGCPSSAIHKVDLAHGLRYTSDLMRTFGKQNVFVEIMFPNDEDFHTRPLEVAQRLGLECVITNDVHFCHKEDSQVHNLCVRARKGFTYDSSELWLKTPEELFDTAKERGFFDETIKSWFDNTQEISRRVESYDIRSKPRLPNIPDVEQKITDITSKKLLALSKEGVSIVDLEEQLIKEFEIFKEAGLLDYFYIVWDIHNFCKQNNIKIGLRGSAVGCTMAYLLDMTDINPLEYGLIFERFYNPKRVDYPDIDSDIASDRRQDVLEYASEKWGAFPVSTDNRYNFKSLIRDIGRVLNIDSDTIDKISEFGEDSEHFKELCKEKPFVRQAYDVMIGQIRHRGKHAGGISISDVTVPIERLSDGTLATAWTESGIKELFEVGIVKFDFLGLQALAQIASMEQLTSEAPPCVYDDSSVFELFKAGNTSGIFQYGGSSGIKAFTKLVRPETIGDLIAINALYRPGALDSGTAYKYPDWMENPRKLHARIDPILAETYGVICYQEQFMKIFAEVTGLDFGDSDKARKIISTAHKMRPDNRAFWKSFEKLKGTFFGNGTKNGFSLDILDLLWSEIETHGRYSFNKSHSTAYAILAYQMAWYKTHYTTEFYTALLRHSQKYIQTIVFECIQEGIGVMPPNINKSGKTFETDGENIYFPLRQVKYFGEKGVDHVLRERSENGPFLSYDNFNKRIARKACNKRVRENLFIIGAFDGFNDEPSNALDESSIPLYSDKEAQIKSLGFRIPTPELVSLHSKHSDSRTVAGIVSEIESRNNGYGDYFVVRLSPFGSFWTDKKPSFGEGDFLVVGKSEYGKMLKGRRLK